MFPHNHQPFSIFRPIVLILTVGLLAGLSWAQSTTRRVSGELMAAKGATIDGSGAVSGQTVFNSNRVRTGKNGQAVISVGKRGRFEVGAETDLTMKLLAENVGGEIKSGNLKLSTPVGISISVVTPKGTVATDGLKATILNIAVNKDATRVTAILGDAKVLNGSRLDQVNAGEEISIAPDSVKRKYVMTGIMASGSALAAATSLGGNANVPGASPAPTSSRTPGVFADLLNNSLNYSLNRLANDRPNDPHRFFDTTITCRDHDNIACRRRSGINP